MKHAYCILAHGSPGILKVLIGLLDDPRNDIYLHLDAKVDVGAFRDLRPVRAGFAFVKERVNANWGGRALSARRWRRFPLRRRADDMRTAICSRA